VLNGIRRFVKSGRIQPKQVAIHFFSPSSADMAQVVSPQIDATGNIDIWPDGFFDQFDKDMNHFAGWD
jgi:predicted ATPase